LSFRKNGLRTPYCLKKFCAWHFRCRKTYTTVFRGSIERARSHSACTFGSVQAKTIFVQRAAAQHPQLRPRSDSMINTSSHTPDGARQAFTYGSTLTKLAEQVFESLD
jgi:hypothetical protein